MGAWKGVVRADLDDKIASMPANVGELISGIDDLVRAVYEGDEFAQLLWAYAAGSALDAAAEWLDTE